MVKGLGESVVLVNSKVSSPPAVSLTTVIELERMLVIVHTMSSPAATVRSRAVAGMEEDTRSPVARSTHSTSLR